MNIRKLSLFFSLILLMSCSFGISAAAAEVEGFFTADMELEAFSRSDGVDTDITDKITVGADTYDGVNSTRYTVPLTTGKQARFITAYQGENLNSTHEYNLSFKVQSSLPSSTSFICYLYFYGPSGDLISVQTLATLSGSSFKSGWNDVSINFVPNISNLTTGYTNKIVFQFISESNSLQYFRLSNFVELTDNNSSDSLLRDILYAITTLDTNIDGYFNRLEFTLIKQLYNLDNNIDSYFDELGGQLVSAITSLDTHIDGYFDLLLDGIITNDNALSDKLHDYLDEFKPRFYQTLNWSVAYLNPNSGQVENTSAANAIVSEYLKVLGSPYFIEFHKSEGKFVTCQVFVYDLNNNFIKVINVAPDSEPLELAQGYNYRFRLYQGDNLFNYYGNELNKVCNTVVKVYADEGWLTAFGNSIIQGFYNIMNPGVYEEPTSNAWEDSKDEFDRIESELPTFDASDMTAVDISDYNSAFGCVRYLFDRFISVSGLSTLLSFSLIFGLGVFLIGRRVGG